MTTKELAIATSTIWVILAAILVMFMQAGFAFLEAGLTRMKNVGHIAAKNVLVLAIASIVYYLVGFGIAFGDGGNGLWGGSGFLPSVDELLTVGAAPFSWFAAIPAAAGYLFEVVFCAVSLAIVWGAMAERTRLWVYFAFGVAYTLIYSLVSHWIWSPDGWLFARGHAGLRRLDRRPLPGCARGTRGGAAARAADRQVRARREAERDPRPQHGVHDARRDHPLVRLVRLQRGLDAQRRLRRRRLLRVRRAEHEPRGGGRRARRGRHVVDRDQEARPVDDAERRDRGARRDHRGLRVRRPVGGDRDRLRRRRDRRLRRARSSSGSASTTRSARSPRTAWPACGARSRSASSPCPRSRRSSPPAPAASSTAAGCTSSASRRSAWRPSARSRSPRRSAILWLFKVTVGIRTDEDVETAGLDVSEHGMWGYPEFYIPVPGGYGTDSHGHLGPRTRGRAAPPPRSPRRPRWSRRLGTTHAEQAAQRASCSGVRQLRLRHREGDGDRRGRLLRPRLDRRRRRTAAALLAASASGCGAPPLSTIAVTRPSERFAAAASACAFARAFATAAFERLAVLLGLVAARERRPVDLVGAGRRRPRRSGRPPWRRS